MRSTMLTKRVSHSDVLQMDAKILLHTRLAQSMFNYSWQHGKMGLLQFAKLTSTLWKAAHSDDPYADWILVKTYKALFHAQEKMKLLEEQLAVQLGQLRGITTMPILNASPIPYPLQFSTIFGFMGAALLADADYVLRQILTLKRLGIPVNEDMASINQVVKHLQDVFSIPRQWRHTGVTRKDMLEHNQKAQEAIVLFGEIPSSILNQITDFNSLQKDSHIDAQ
jgi:integrating conjugative element protein (TIGR03761 family)